MDTKKIISTIGTYVIIGIASTAGAALWTNVLEGRIRRIKAKPRYSKSGNVIIVEF